MVFWLASLLPIVLLVLPLSAPLWRLTGFAALLAYPWQLLALAGLPLAFLAGSVACRDARLQALPAWSGLLALTILASYPYLAPRFTQVDPGREPLALFQPAGADAPQMAILDAEIDPPAEITSTLALTLTWQALGSPAEDYTVFVHVLDGEGEKLVQRDTQPCDGECPTGTWQPGEIVLDTYRLALPAGAARSPDRLAVGLYLLETGDRVPVVGRQEEALYLDVP
jgi:hypothetical protein